MLAVGPACSFFGQGAARTLRPPEVREALTLAELEDIQVAHFADDVPIDFERMRFWSRQQASDYFANDGALLPAPTPLAAPQPAEADAGAGTDALKLVLPFMIGLPARGQRVGNWAALRGAASRAGVADGAHGFCAVGLPPSSVACVLTASRAALRPALGSASPVRLGTAKLGEWRSECEAREKRRQIEKDRLRASRHPPPTPPPLPTPAHPAPVGEGGGA